MWLTGFFLSIIAILEGLGIYGGHELSYFFVVIFPFFILLHDRITDREKALRFPKILTICYAVFIFFLIISTFFSVNIAKSMPGIVYYPALFFISMYAYNHKKEVSSWLLPFLITASLILVLFSILGWFFPLRGFSLLYSRLNFHNNLGDFLVIPIVAGAYYLMENKNRITSIILLFLTMPVFLLSFSRSAFVAVVVAIAAMFLLKKRKTKTFYFAVLMVFLLIGLFFFIPNVNLNDCCRGLSQFVSHRDNLMSSRDSFFISALRGIKDYPLTGVGFGNFGDVSFRYNDLILFWTRSSHNIFLDLATEIGLPAMAVFMTLAVYLLIKSKKNILFYVFLGLLANFQLYYNFKSYLVIFVFFILIGLIYEEGSHKTVPVRGNSLLVLFAIPLIAIQFNIFSMIFINLGNYKAALFFNPAEYYLYRALINESVSKGTYRDNMLYRRIYDRIYSTDLEVTEYLAGIDLHYGDKNAALAKYQRSLMWHPYSGDQGLRLRRLYYLTYELKGKSAADKFINDYLMRVENMFEYSDSFIKKISREVAGEVNPPLIRIKH